MAHISKISAYVKLMRKKRSASDGALTAATNKRAREYEADETAFPESITLPTDQFKWLCKVLVPALDDCESDELWSRRVVDPDPRVARDVREMLPTDELRDAVRRKGSLYRVFLNDMEQRFVEIADGELVPLRTFVCWLQLRAQATGPFGDWPAFWRRFGDVGRPLSRSECAENDVLNDRLTAIPGTSPAGLSRQLPREMSECSSTTPSKTLIAWWLCCALAFRMLSPQEVVSLARDHGVDPTSGPFACLRRVKGRLVQRCGGAYRYDYLYDHVLYHYLKLGPHLNEAIREKHGTSPPFAVLRQPNIDVTLLKLAFLHKHQFSVEERVQIRELIYEKEYGVTRRVQAAHSLWLWRLCSKQVVGIAIALASHPAALPAEVIFSICKRLTIIVRWCHFPFIRMVQSLRRIQASKKK